MKNGSILIISNDEHIGKKIAEKVNLLRECDVRKVVTYLESISVLNTTQPSLILVYCSKSDSIGIIKEIRQLKALDKVPIILVMDTLIEDILMYAFDNGIDDFFFLTDSDAVILMRIFLTLQKSVLYKQIEINNEILVSSNIIEKETGVYVKEHAPTVLRNFFSKSIEENLDNTVFMYLKPVSLENKKLQMPKIASTIKSLLRGNDIVAYGKNSGFYLILYNSGEAGTDTVAERIKKSLANICKIYFVASPITTSFEEMEQVLTKSLKEQIEKLKEFNYLNASNYNKTSEVCDIKDENGKKFQDFKKEFLENFEKIIAPVFYQEQTSISTDFRSSKVNYSITEKECRFTIEQDGIKSELLITYPSYIKVIMDIKHFEANAKPKIKRLTFDFEDISEEKISTIIKDMVNEFAQILSLKLLY